MLEPPLELREQLASRDNESRDLKKSCRRGWKSCHRDSMTSRHGWKSCHRGLMNCHPCWTSCRRGLMNCHPCWTSCHRDLMNCRPCWTSCHRGLTSYHPCWKTSLQMCSSTRLTSYWTHGRLPLVAPCQGLQQSLQTSQRSTVHSNRAYLFLLKRDFCAAGSPTTNIGV